MKKLQKTFFLALLVQVSFSYLIGQTAFDMTDGSSRSDSAFASGYFRIVQISDTQLGFTGDSLNLDATYFEQAVKSINNLTPKPDVVINTGDLVNNPGNDDQWREYISISKKVKAPYFEVIGNHDGWSTAGLEKFRNRFQRNDYYSFTVRNCLFVSLNSWYLKEPDKNPQEAKKQQDFLVSTLLNSSARFKFILIHHPLYLKNAEEKEEYFTLPEEQRKWLLDVSMKNNVKLILTGHFHRNNVVTYRDSLTIITTGPTSKPLGNNDDNTKAFRGFRIIDINLKNGTVNQEYIPLTKPAGIPDTHSGFSFLCLGDTHFDAINHHDMDWVRKVHPGDTSQINHYSEVTKSLLPALYTDLNHLIHADTSNISFVVHAGDFVEGLCGSYSLAKLQFNDFIKFEEKYIHIPYLVTKGNHDITGPGADSAFTGVVFPFINKNTGSVVNDSKYVVRKNNAVFFFYDAYRRESLNWLEEEIKKYRDVRFKFVVMHEPVVPINARSKWGVFMKTSEKESREKLLNLLGDNKVLVIAGHLHKHSLVVRKTKNGKFLQLALCSVINGLIQKPELIKTGIKDYNEALLELEPDFSPETKQERIDILMHEKPFVEYYELGNTSGYSLFNVSDDKVVVDIYSGTGLNKWKSVDLTELLNK